jgi:hypothetical protein
MKLTYLSLSAHPARSTPRAGFVSAARVLGIRTCEINLEPSDNAEQFDERRYGLASEAVPTWVEWNPDFRPARLVPRHQPHVAPRSDSQRPVAIEFDFVVPIEPSGNFATGRHCIGSTNRAVSFARHFAGSRGTFASSRYCFGPRRIAAIVVAFMIPKF